MSRTNFPLTGILTAGPGRIQMFVTRNFVQPTWHIERLLLRTDGFASLSAPWTGGEMLTKPLTFSGTALEINYRTAAAGKPQADPGTLAGKPVRLRQILTDICTRMKELVALASWTRCGR